METKNNDEAARQGGPAISIEDLSKEEKAQTAEKKPAARKRAPKKAPAAPTVPTTATKAAAKAKRAAKPEAAPAEQAQKAPKKERARKGGGFGIARLSQIASISVAVAVIAVGFGIYSNITSASRYATLEAETTPVVVATHEMAAGTTIAAGDVTVKEFTVDTAPAGAVSSVGDVIGKTTSSHLSANGAVSSGDLAGDAATTLAGRLRAGYVASSVTVSQQTGVAGMVHQGDHVTVYGTVNDGATVVIATGARVLALDESLDAYKSTYTAITLEVTSSQAEEIATVLEHGTITCSVEPPAAS